MISPHNSTTMNTNNTNNTSPKMRRRSSTSDMEKFERRTTDKFVTTIDEQDVVSEDAVSLSSNDILEEEDVVTPVSGSLEERDETREEMKTETVKLRSLYVADKGNRLSQLELPESNPDNRMESVVEIEYDL